MIPNILNKTVILFIGIISGMALTITAYATDYVPTLISPEGENVQTQVLYAGQNIDVGSVSMTISGDNLLITLNSNAGWQFNETHLWVGTDISDMPQTRKGNPKIGNFPYKSTEFADPTSHTIPISLAILNFTCPMQDTTYYIAAHASVVLTDNYGEVIQQETAWADGDRFVEKGMWGTYATITLHCETQDEPNKGTGESCETAFAYSDSTANDFLLIDEDNDGKGDFNRWGWSNGPISAGVYSWDIYAGAGRSDITKGTWVGTLNINYDGVMAIVTFNMDPLATYFMEENHLYVGNEILPRNINNEFTVAPGQYPTIHSDLNNATTDTYIVNGLSGNLYIVAHATVCGFSNQNVSDLF